MPKLILADLQPYNSLSLKPLLSIRRHSLSSFHPLSVASRLTERERGLAQRILFQLPKVALRLHVFRDGPL